MAEEDYENIRALGEEEQISSTNQPHQAQNPYRHYRYEHTNKGSIIKSSFILMLYDLM